MKVSPASFLFILCVYHGTSITVTVYVLLLVPIVILTFAVPGAFAVISPILSTLTMLESELLKAGTMFVQFDGDIS